MATEEELAQQADDELNTVLVEPEPVEPEEDDDDDDSEPGTPAPEARPSRKERRRARAGNYNELKENNERLARELAQTREAQARMEGLLQANLQRPQQQGPHPLELAVEDAQREQDEFYKSFHARAGTMSPEEQQQAGRRSAELDRKKMMAAARLAAAQMGLGPQVNPQQIQRVAFQEQLNMRYPDIAADQRATELGGHIARALIAERGQATWEILDEAAEETRKRLGMKSTRVAPKPTPQQKAKFVSEGKGASGGGTAENKPLRITKKQAQMAENAYPALPAGKAHQKWWNEVGKKYA